MRLRDIMGALGSDALSPVEVLDLCLTRLPKALHYGAFTVVDEAGARETAALLNPRRRGPLYGIPCVVKDLIDVEGLPTSRGGSMARIARADAPIVRRLREAGAIIVGKTRTDELGLGTLTPGVRDPREPARSVGGSSGGSAVAVMLDVVPLAVATDTAGSARIPAAACGVAGMCLSAEAFAGKGVVGLSPDFDRMGLIARDPADLQLAWQSLTHWAPTTPIEVGPVALLATASLGRVDPERIAAAEDAARRLVGAGTVAVADGPSFGAFGAPRATVITADAAAAYPLEEVESPVARRQIEEGSRYTPNEITAARGRLWALAAELRSRIGDGVLLTPTLPTPPPLWDEVRDLEEQLHTIGRLTRLCAPVNSSGLVAVTIPWGTDSWGRPLGVQVIGHTEAQVLAAAVRLAAVDAGPDDTSEPLPRPTRKEGP